MVNRKKPKVQIIIYKTLHRKKTFIHKNTTTGAADTHFL